MIWLGGGTAAQTIGPAPGDGITYAEAAGILGCAVSTVQQLVQRGELTPSGQPHSYRRLSRTEAEWLALARWRPRRPTVSLYWADTAQAAGMLGVTPGRVRQLCEAGRLPYEVAADGTRVFRREQLLTVANARLSRRLR